MSWLQLFVDAERESISSIEDALLEAGAVCVTLQEHIPQGSQEKPILEPALGETPLWDSSRITGLFNADCDTEATNHFLSSRLPSSSTIRWEQLEDKDWEREWMDNYHPIQCAPKLWICPSWQTPPDPDAINILLDPGLAFGTGTHPTTFMCLQWLAEQNLNALNIIDYGCGSGILGIATLLMGAHAVTGVDIDPQALLASHDNAKRNHLNVEQFPVLLPSQIKTPLAKADIVLANILAGPLVELAPKLLELLNIQGKICLSGILAEQAEKVIAAYSDSINFDPICQKDEWVRLSGIRFR